MTAPVQRGDLIAEALFEREHVGGDIGAQRVDLGADVVDFSTSHVAATSALRRHFRANLAQDRQDEIFRFGHCCGFFRDQSRDYGGAAPAPGKLRPAPPPSR